MGGWDPSTPSWSKFQKTGISLNLLDISMFRLFMPSIREAREAREAGDWSWAGIDFFRDRLFSNLVCWPSANNGSGGNYCTSGSPTATGVSIRPLYSRLKRKKLPHPSPSSSDPTPLARPTSTERKSATVTSLLFGVDVGLASGVGSEEEGEGWGNFFRLSRE